MNKHQSTQLYLSDISHNEFVYNIIDKKTGLKRAMNNAVMFWRRKKIKGRR